jgi:uncharacterized protein (DUF427 family)
MTSGHKIKITPAGRHVEVSAGGQKLAASDRALRLDETGLPARYYIPREDVRTDLLRPTTHTTTCPFKGQAAYWSVQAGDGTLENVVWSYETPIPGVEEIAGLLCFYNERVELTLGERRPSGSETASRH